jgi:hypothetical protein
MGKLLKYSAKFAKKFVENMMHDHPTVSAENLILDKIEK